MKKIIFCIIFLLLPLFLFSSWVDVDGINQDKKVILDTTGSSFVPDIEIDNNGYPHIVWFDDSQGNMEIYYMWWNGSEWVDVDGVGLESINVSKNSTTSKYPKLELDSQNRPHIVWEDGDYPNREIYYLWWNGSEWVDADGSGTESINISNTPEKSGHPDFKLDSNGYPHVAWHNGEEEDNPLADIYYLRWNGVSWVDADGAGTESARIYSSPYASLWVSMDIDSQNRPHIVWSDGEEENREIYYLWWNGSAWVDVDGVGTESINISNNSGYSSWPNIFVDNSDHPHIVWEDNTNNYDDIYYMWWNGSEWVDVDGSGLDNINVSNTYHYSTVPKIKLDNNGIPHIIWQEGSIETCEIYCVKWNGTQWSDESGSGFSQINVSNDSINSEWASFTLDNNGYPNIVWSNGVVLKPHDINYLRWLPGDNPTLTPTPTWTIDLTQNITPQITITPDNCWVAMDKYSQESKFISKGEKPDLFIDSNNNPHVVWESDNKIYYMWWNGTNWVDVDGTGQESKLVSFTISNCREPSIFLDSNNNPNICFIGGLWTGYETVYYIKWNGNEWVDADGTGIEGISLPVPTGGYAENPSLYLDSNNYPYIAWSDYPIGKTYTVKDIYIIKWNGNSWSDVENTGYLKITITTNISESLNPSLVLDNMNNPHIAWQDSNTPNFSIYYKYFDGNIWKNLGGSDDIVNNPSLTNSYLPDLKLDSNNYPHIAFIDNGRLCYIKWNGASWVDYDGNGQDNIILPFGSNVKSVSLFIDNNNFPHILWAQNDGIYYAKWNGNGWVDADNTGLESIKINDTNINSTVSLKLSTDEIPFVSWYDEINGDNFIGVLEYICNNLTPTPTSTITLTPTQALTFTITLTPTITPTHSNTPTFTITPTPYPEGFFIVYPNPFNLKTAKIKKLKFLNVKENEKIYIFTISGEYVTTLSSKGVKAEWDGTNRFKDKVSPGIYYYVYREKSGIVKKKGKIFVINK